MDAHLRLLERRWESSGDRENLTRLLQALLRIRSLEAWERAAEAGEEDALKYIELLRNFTNEKLERADIFINIYEDFTARTSLLCVPSEITQIRRFLRKFYTKNDIFYGGRTVYDISLQHEVPDPPATMKIEYSIAPCFRFSASEIREEAGRLSIEEEFEHYMEGSNLSNPAMLRRLSPINLPGTRDYYVSFQLIDFYEDPDLAEAAEPSEPDPQIAQRPHWINIYETVQNYGGPEEGGWHYYAHFPLSAVYVGLLPAEIFNNNEESLLFIEHTTSGYNVRPNFQYPNTPVPQNLNNPINFLANHFEHITHGDIHSVLGGSYLDIRLEPHPAIIDPFIRPHYC